MLLDREDVCKRLHARRIHRHVIVALFFSAGILSIRAMSLGYIRPFLAQHLTDVDMDVCHTFPPQDNI